MTAVQVGNYGINEADVESDGPKVKGFVVRELSPVVSNWRATTSLETYLADASIPGVEGIDTRAIAKKLRVSGALNACISTEDISDAQAVEMAKNFGGLIGVDFVKEVTAKSEYDWDPEHKESKCFTVTGTDLVINHLTRDKRFTVAALDFGANIQFIENCKDMVLMCEYSQPTHLLKLLKNLVQMGSFYQMGLATLPQWIMRTRQSAL